jgi:ABC-type transport system involved in multi-copper enzyme maturation permease subunit
MMRTLGLWKALVVAGSLETIRRKDIYVVLVLTGLMVAGAWAFGFFGVSGLEVFIRDVTFTSIGLFSTILTVILAARQIPEEVQRRTIYPLMARPITRWQLLTGKWLAASLAAVCGFLLLAGTGCALLAAFGIGVGPILWQYVVLKSLGILWLSAMTVGLSVYLTQGANVVLCLILAFGSGAFTRLTLLVAAKAGPAALVDLLYGLLPHYDFFDLGRKVTYAWPPIPAWVISALAVYAVIGGLLWLFVGWLRFRKAAL